MNLADVAKRAKVSTATVSRVLNNVALVKESTRERVLRAIEELKYYPNVNARTLASGRSRTIGMIVSNLENPFFLDVFRTVDDEAHRRGYEVVIVNTNYRPERLVSSVRLMLGRGVSGLAIIVSEMEPSVMRELAGASLPTVFYDVGRPGKKITNIKVDYRSGMEKILEHLRALGHRRLAFVGHHTTLGPLHERKQAFLKIAAGYAPRTKVMAVANADGLVGGQHAAREVLASRFAPTAFVCVNDVMAVGVLRELQARGIGVPDEISVTGFDNIGLADFVTPGLTTANIPREQIGHLICGALLPTHRGSYARGKEIVIETELVVRDSTAEVAGGLSRRPDLRTA